MVGLRPGRVQVRADRDAPAGGRRLIAAYKVPRHIEFAAALPRTSSGKVLRRDLRDRMARRVTAD